MAGIALIGLAVLATLISLGMAVAHGGGGYGVFVGGAGAGVILIILGFDERRRELERWRSMFGPR